MEVRTIKESCVSRTRQARKKNKIEKVTQFMFFIISIALLIAVVVLRWGNEAPDCIPESQSEISLPTALETQTASLETEIPRVDYTLQQQLQSYCEQLDGTWDIWVESLSNHTMAHVQQNIRENQPVISASLIKLFIMGATYDALECGELSDEAIEQEIYDMITVSDNNAANDLIRKLGNGNTEAGMEKVNDFATKIGCIDSKLYRVMLAENGLQNYTSASDCAHILKMIYSGQCVSKESSDKMMSFLKQQKVNNRIPAGIPGNVAVAHKTGDLSGICCADVGLVFAENGDYILCAICNDQANDRNAADQIMGLSELVYHFFTVSVDREVTMN